MYLFIYVFVFLSADTWYNVEAITGRKAILPCELNSLEGSADLVYVVLWYRNDEKEPIYSFDKRPGRVSSSESRHIIHESLRNRAKFLIGEVPALEIDPISGNDEANYTCRVDFRIATSRTTRVALQVVVPPNDPVLRVNGDVINDPLLGPLHEGQALTLTCSVTGGDPSPRVVWTRNGKRCWYLIANGQLDRKYCFHSGLMPLRIRVTQDIRGPQEAADDHRFCS
ncbi:CD276 antigen-like [Oratosquilla oratoria]|uniref:CD276 antigen-like n=1 Tax=Oratosquilla oratoria TaxID=337810 RepID=UPI003F76A8ED